MFLHKKFITYSICILKINAYINNVRVSLIIVFFYDATMLIYNYYMNAS